MQSKLIEKNVPAMGKRRAEIQEQYQVRPRPCPRPVKAAQPATVAPETLASASREHPVTYEVVVSPQASPVKYGGIPEEENDDEEQAAARSSPVKAGRRVTSNVSCNKNLSNVLF